MSIELINLYSNMSAQANYSVMLPITTPAGFSATVISTLFASSAFTENKNLILETPDLATGNYVITDSALNIWIYDQCFTF